MFFRRRLSVDAGTTIVLTPLGKEKVEKYEGEGPKFRVLTVLSEEGPSSVAEIAEKSGIGTGKVKHFIEKLTKGGFVRPMRGEE